MVSPISIIALVVTIIGVILTYFWHLENKTPTPTEITQAIHYRMGINFDNVLRTKHHISNPVDAKVSGNNNWLDEVENPTQQRGYALLNNIFVGTAEIVLYFEVPNEPPSISRIKEHPNYGKGIEQENSEAGVNSFEVKKSSESLILNVEFYSDTSDRASGLILATALVVGRMVDDIVSGHLDKQPEEITGIHEIFSGERLEGTDNPVTKIKSLHDSDFVHPQNIGDGRNSSEK